jgi:flagellar hook-length control protein FliK
VADTHPSSARRATTAVAAATPSNATPSPDDAPVTASTTDSPQAIAPKSSPITDLTTPATLTVAAAITAHPAPSPHQTAATPAPTPAPPAPEQQFAQSNHLNIVSGIRGELLPHGGTMQLRLDPPDLGAMQVTVHMRDGVMTASFQTSTDDATRLLSHSLDQLRHSLESQGVVVDKLQVQQTPRQQHTPSGDDQRQQHHDGSPQQQQQEQQRREMLRRMWRRLAGGRDPMDLIA